MVERVQLGIGNVPIVLDGEERELKPSLNAVQVISRQYGGIRAAIEQVLKYDIDAVTNIVVLGLGLAPAGAKEIPNKVFRTGLAGENGLAAPCIRYLTILSNGGRPPEPVEASDDDTSPPSAQKSEKQK